RRTSSEPSKRAAPSNPSTSAGCSPSCAAPARPSPRSWPWPTTPVIQTPSASASASRRTAPSVSTSRRRARRRSERRERPTSDVENAEDPGAPLRPPPVSCAAPGGGRNPCLLERGAGASPLGFYVKAPRPRSRAVAAWPSTTLPPACSTRGLQDVQPRLRDQPAFPHALPPRGGLPGAVVLLGGRQQTPVGVPLGPVEAHDVVLELRDPRLECELVGRAPAARPRPLCRRLARLRQRPFARRCPRRCPRRRLRRRPLSRPRPRRRLRRRPSLTRLTAARRRLLCRRLLCRRLLCRRLLCRRLLCRRLLCRRLLCRRLLCRRLLCRRL